MKNLLILFSIFTIFSSVVFAGNIEYGYNAKGEYAPKSVNGKKIEYGYNAHGDYVQKSIGGEKIEYGYNARGQYVPKSIGK